MPAGTNERGSFLALLALYGLAKLGRCNNSAIKATHIGRRLYVMKMLLKEIKVSAG